MDGWGANELLDECGSKQHHLPASRTGTGDRIERKETYETNAPTRTIEPVPSQQLGHTSVTKHNHLGYAFPTTDLASTSGQLR